MSYLYLPSRRERLTSMIVERERFHDLLDRCFDEGAFLERRASSGRKVTASLDGLEGISSHELDPLFDHTIGSTDGPVTRVSVILYSVRAVCRARRFIFPDRDREWARQQDDRDVFVVTDVIPTSS